MTIIKITPNEVEMLTYAVNGMDIANKTPNHDGTQDTYGGFRDAMVEIIRRVFKKEPVIAQSIIDCCGSLPAGGDVLADLTTFVQRTFDNATIEMGTNITWN